ncbi:MAG: DUF2220 domain-containing protein [Desulfotomaculum sp.]|nr:DUF2220 domain-containing protein [Desulfotomaculum sp.]MCL0080872.1 DUF2220 domain-containing protein [Peptococcaceae bacterium]
MDKLYHCLDNHQKKTIALSDLQANFTGGEVDYGAFAAAVLELENDGVLVPVKAPGRNQKSPSLANKYTLKHPQGHQQTLHRQNFYQRLQRVSLQLHKLIQLDRYYKAGVLRWEQDLPWIKKLDSYLKSNCLPPAPATAPERSYHITGNEKWYDEQNGKEFLEMVGISDQQLAIVNRPEPFGWAVNSLLLNSGQHRHQHLIVENKAPFHALLPVLNEQKTFTTLIYGRGKAIVASLALFAQQSGFNSLPRHTFYYFGDLDYEGIAIWYALYARHQNLSIKPVLPFYEALLQKKYSLGKEYQQPNLVAVEMFAGNFTPDCRLLLLNMLQAGGYLPQEALATPELQQIWRKNFKGD